MKLNQLTGIAALLMCAGTAVIAADAHHDHPPAAKPAADSHAAAAKDAPAKEAATKEAATKEAVAKEAPTKDAVAPDDQPKPAMKKTRKQARAKPAHKAPTHGTPDAHGHADSAAPAAHGSHKAVAQDGHANPKEGHASKRVRVKDRSAAAVPASHAANDGAHASHAPDASHAASSAKPAHDDHAAPTAKATSAEHKDHHDAHAAHATPAAKDAPAAKDTHAAHAAAAHHDAHAAPPDSHGHTVADKTSHAAASADYCNPPLKSEVAALFDRWNASLLSGDPKKVVANYAPGSVLLPTVSNRARFTAAEKEAYFAHFLVRRPEGTIDDRVIDVDCNSATDAGLYTFRFSDGTSVKARYSFSYRRIGSQWLITSHHSSGMPENAEAATDHPVSAKQAKQAGKSDEKADQGSPAKGWVRYP